MYIQQRGKLIAKSTDPREANLAVCFRRFVKSNAA